ncbi:MAG: peroxiredoxin family protein [Planctomycetes bacterium]|nr:peroxiredoxin family protein [Planctomycetota bacterium]
MVELQSGIERINTANIQVVAISYDSPEVLSDFAKKRKITFPLLSDPESKVIKAYGVLNEGASGRQAGIPHPGTFLIDQKGTIRANIPGTVRKRHTADDLLEVAKDKLSSG